MAVAEDVNPQHLIIASRLFISLTIGFVAGALVALAIGIDPANIATEEILGLAAAGYAGTDAIEGMIGRITPTRPEETGKAETRGLLLSEQEKMITTRRANMNLQTDFPAWMLTGEPSR